MTVSFWFGEYCCSASLGFGLYIYIYIKDILFRDETVSWLK